MVCHYIFVVLKSAGFLGLISLLEFTVVKNSCAVFAGVSHLTILKKRVPFSSILKRLQSGVSQHGGDTSRSAVFVILVDGASCTSLDVF